MLVSWRHLSLWRLKSCALTKDVCKERSYTNATWCFIICCVYGCICIHMARTLCRSQHFCNIEIMDSNPTHGTLVLTTVLDLSDLITLNGFISEKLPVCNLFSVCKINKKYGPLYYFSWAPVQMVRHLSCDQTLWVGIYCELEVPS